MLATFFIEVFLAIYILTTRKMNKNVKIAVLILIFLSIFQLAEYGICEGFGYKPDVWAKIGFISITLLPPLGLHLVHSLASKRRNVLVYSSYGLATLWIGVFLFGGLMTSPVCSGNYVIFNIADPWETLYYIYYDFILLLSMALGLYFATQQKTRRIKVALYTLVFGYAAFILPSMLFAYIGKNDHGALPSILCGFAVILAVTIAFGVVPKISKKQ